MDVAELLRVASIESAPPAFVTPIRLSTTETVFRPPVDEFQLSRVSATADRPHSAGPVRGADTLLVVEGTGRVRVAERSEPLGRGTSVIVPHGAVYSVETAAELTLFNAAVP